MKTWIIILAVLLLLSVVINIVQAIKIRKMKGTLYDHSVMHRAMFTGFSD